MLPRCGRVAHICEANSILQSVFPAAIAFFETVKFAILWFVRNKLQIRTRQRGNCSKLVGKSRGGTPFCRMLKIVFSRSNVSHETIECLPNVQGICRMKNRLGHLCGAQKQKVFWSSNFSKMLARFRASSPDRCPQAAKSLCHAFGTRSGWWEKRQLFEAGRTRPPRLVKP